MHKSWRFLLWLGVAAIGAAIWLAWWATLGFPSPICPQGGAEDHCLSYDQIQAWTTLISDSAWNVAEFANDWAALIAAIFAAVLAIFAFRLWRSTDKLWSVTNKTLEHAEQTTRKQLRAYLAVEPLGITEYIGHNYLIGHFQICSFGKTPARNVSIYSTIGLDADGARSDFPIGTPRISSTVLQPGAKMEFSSPDGWPIPADQIDASGPLKLNGFLYVWGEVLYTDDFNTIGWTAFCHRYPCDMFGMTEDQETKSSRTSNRSIDRKFARYHEDAGNDAG